MSLPRGRDATGNEGAGARSRCRKTHRQIQRRHRNGNRTALALHIRNARCGREDGTIPAGIEAQSRLAWKYIPAAIERARMTTADLVKVTTSLTNAKDVSAYVNVRGSSWAK
jgi:hypothetical protein